MGGPYNHPEIGDLPAILFHSSVERKAIKKLNAKNRGPGTYV